MEEGNDNNFEKERTIQTLKEENAILKERVLEFQKSVTEAREMAKLSKEMSLREELLVKFEEENMKVKEELKWKKEKFEHLKEAHEKLREELKSKEREWKEEKSDLIDVISTIQSQFDSQAKDLVDLRSRVETSKQALLREQSKRRNLEIKLSESASSFDNVFEGRENVKSNLKSLIDQSEREIATLKDLMGSKESDYKEMEYEYKKIKKENEELKVLVKEMHEERIFEARACNEPRRKKAHKESSKKLEAKETDLGSQIEKIRVELTSCMLEIQNRDEVINELKQELGIMQNQSKNSHDECLKLLEDREAKLGCQIEKMKDELSSCILGLKGKDELIEKLKQESEEKESLIVESLMKNEESFLTTLVLKSFLEEKKIDFAEESQSVSKSVHDECLKILEASEAKLACQIEKMKDELSSCILELKGRDELIEKLKQESEEKESLIVESLIKNEESFLTTLVFKSFLEEKKINFAEENALVSKSVHDECLKILEASEAKLACQIEKMKDELSSCTLELEGKIEFIEKLKQTSENKESLIMDLSMKNEESFLTALVLKSFLEEKKMNFGEENSLVISLLKEKYEQACKDLDRVNDELVQTFTEVSKVQFELQIWKSEAERLNADLEKSYNMRREMEESLLAQVTVEVNLKEENRTLVDVLKEKDSNIENLKEMANQETLLSFQELENELRIKESEVNKLTNFVEEFFDRMTNVFDHDIQLMGKLRNIVKIRVDPESEDLFESEKENAAISDIVASKKVKAKFDCRSPLRDLDSLV